MEKETFGERLLKRRKELKLSQAALGKMAKVAHVTISQWERNETQPTGKRMFALSSALQCTPAWLLFGDEEHVPQTPVVTPPQQELTPIQKELLELFDALPSSEQEAQIIELRARVENNEKLFHELLQARKRQRIKKPG